MQTSSNATSSVAASPPPARAAEPSVDLSALPVIDVPFTSIHGVRRVDEDAGIHWEICIGARSTIAIAHGSDFKSTLAEAMKDLARRHTSLVK